MRTARRRSQPRLTCLRLEAQARRATLRASGHRPAARPNQSGPTSTSGPWRTTNSGPDGPCQARCRSGIAEALVDSAPSCTNHSSRVRSATASNSAGGARSRNPLRDPTRAAGATVHPAARRHRTPRPDPTAHHARPSHTHTNTSRRREVRPICGVHHHRRTLLYAVKWAAS